MLKVVAAFTLGVMSWSFLEYCIHRWLGHDARLRPNIFGTEHIRHHSQGDYFAPTWKKALAALAAAGVVLPPAVLAAGFKLGVAYTAGFVGFYLVYEALHRLEHVWEGAGPYARWARRHHFWHHFGDPSVNHGVTSPLWDHVFGTYQVPGLIVVPEKLRMRWLEDPSTGELHANLVGTYEIRRSKRRPAPSTASA